MSALMPELAGAICEIRLPSISISPLKVDLPVPSKMVALLMSVVVIVVHRIFFYEWLKALLGRAVFVASTRHAITSIDRRILRNNTCFIEVL